MKDVRDLGRNGVMQAEMAATLYPDARAHPVNAETLYREHASFVVSFLRHMGTADSELDDIVQDVFVIALRKGGYQPGPAAPRTWLASLTLRVMLARRRARARRTRSAMTVDTVSETRTPADVVEARRSLERVQASLDQLSLEQRAAFVLFEIEGESCESIAAMWEVPIGTVYSRLHHARKRFLEAYRTCTDSRDLDRGGER